MTIAIIAAVILLAIVGYFIWTNQKEKKAKQKSRQNHPSNASPLEKFLETKPQVQSTTKSGVTQTQVGRSSSPIANVVPKKAKTSAEIEEEKAQDRRNRIRQERELREQESFARQRRLREQEEYDRRNEQGMYATNPNDFMTGIFVGSMLNESTHDHHDEDTSTRVEEQSSNDTSSSSDYSGTPSYGDSSSSSSSYDGLPAYGGSDSSSSSSDSSSSYSSSYDSSNSDSSSYTSTSDSSSYDPGSSSGGSDW